MGEPVARLAAGWRELLVELVVSFVVVYADDVSI